MTAKWDSAVAGAIEAFQIATYCGADNETAAQVALARARAFMPDASEYEVREALAIDQAERRLALRLAAARTGHTTRRARRKQ